MRIIYVQPYICISFQTYKRKKKYTLTTISLNMGGEIITYDIVKNGEGSKLAKKISNVIYVRLSNGTC